MSFLDQLLIKTSRTFALAIPLLPEPLRREVTVAYLLFRIADTFEDATLWPAWKKIEALEQFGELLPNPPNDQAQQKAAHWVVEYPCEHQGYVELLEAAPAVLGALHALPTKAMELIIKHSLRTIKGMATYVSRTSETDGLQLEGIADLKSYCYVVAGIVGEMLTELFLLECRSLRKIATFLRQKASQFGAGLQLVNILKDCVDDAGDGRRYLPPQLDRAKVFALARQNLDAAARYVLALQRAKAPRGFLAFTALPVLLAWATLDLVERAGPGTKLSRNEVAQIVLGMHEALEQNQPVLSP